jgi:hypothetical protein
MLKPCDSHQYLEEGQQGKATEAVMNHDEVEKFVAIVSRLDRLLPKVFTPKNQERSSSGLVTRRQCNPPYLQAWQQLAFD